MRRNSFQSLLNLLLVLCVAVFASSCSIQRVSLPPGNWQELSIGDRSYAQRLIGTRASELSSYKVLARTIIKSGSEKSAIRLSLVFCPPASFRMDVFPSQSAMTIAVLTAQSGNFSFIDFNEEKAVRSKTAGLVLDKALNVKMQEIDFAYLFSGRMPPSRLDKVELGSWLQLSDGRDLIIRFPARGEQWLVDLDTGLVKSFWVWDVSNERLILEAHLPVFSSERLFPKEEELFLASPQISFTSKISEPKLNEVCSDAVFTVPVPSNFAVDER